MREAAEQSSEEGLDEEEEGRVDQEEGEELMGEQARLKRSPPQGPRVEGRPPEDLPENEAEVLGGPGQDGSEADAQQAPGEQEGHS